MNMFSDKSVMITKMLLDIELNSIIVQYIIELIVNNFCSEICKLPINFKSLNYDR